MQVSMNRSDLETIMRSNLPTMATSLCSSNGMRSEFRIGLQRHLSREEGSFLRIQMLR